MTTPRNSDVLEVTLGELIRRSRLDHGQTQAELADMVGVSQPSVFRWESDENRPEWQLFTFLARYCRVSRETIVRLASKPTRKRR